MNATNWPSQARMARQQERPLSERRTAEVTNYGWRHNRLRLDKWSYTLTIRERVTVRWAERVARKHDKCHCGVMSTFAPERWLAQARSRAAIAAGEANALDVALSTLKRRWRGKAIKRRTIRAIVDKPVPARARLRRAVMLVVAQDAQRSALTAHALAEGWLTND